MHSQTSPVLNCIKFLLRFTNCRMRTRQKDGMTSTGDSELKTVHLLLIICFIEMFNSKDQLVLFSTYNSKHSHYNYEYLSTIKSFHRSSMQVQYWPNNEKLYNSYLVRCAIKKKNRRLKLNNCHQIRYCMEKFQIKEYSWKVLYP